MGSDRSRLDLTSLAAFGAEAERGQYPAIDVGGFLVPGESSGRFLNPGKEEEIDEYAKRGAKGRPEAGSSARSRQRSRRSQAEAEASTTAYAVDRRLISDQLEELAQYHPLAVVTEVSSSSFPHLWLRVPVGLFCDLPFRAELRLEVPLVSRFRLRLPSIRADYSHNAIGEIKWHGPSQFYRLTPGLSNCDYAEPLVPDVRAWARWVGGPLGGMRIESHHQNTDLGICACKPTDWILGVNSLVDFLGMCISWIGKVLHERELGFYPGRQHYGPRKRLERNRLDEFCGCGEGLKRYRDCCLDADRNLSPFQLWAGEYSGIQAYHSELKRQERPAVLL